MNTILKQMITKVFDKESLINLKLLEVLKKEPTQDLKVKIDDVNVVKAGSIYTFKSYDYTLVATAGVINVYDGKKCINTLIVDDNNNTVLSSGDCDVIDHLKSYLS